MADFDQKVFGITEYLLLQDSQTISCNSLAHCVYSAAWELTEVISAAKAFNIQKNFLECSHSVIKPFITFKFSWGQDNSLELKPGKMKKKKKAYQGQGDASERIWPARTLYCVKDFSTCAEMKIYSSRLLLDLCLLNKCKITIMF